MAKLSTEAALFIAFAKNALEQSAYNDLSNWLFVWPAPNAPKKIWSRSYIPNGLIQELVVMLKPKTPYEVFLVSFYLESFELLATTAKEEVLTWIKEYNSYHTQVCSSYTSAQEPISYTNSKQLEQTQTIPLVLPSLMATQLG